MVTRPALWRRVRPGLAQPRAARRRHEGWRRHRQGAERRPRRLARGLGAVPRRRRLCLARRAARRDRRREPRGRGLRASEPRSSGPRSGWCSAAATTTGSTSPAGTRCARRAKGSLGRRPQADDALADPAPRPGRRDGPRHAEAGRVHAPADREQLLARAGGLRALLRLGHHHHRGRDDRPGLPRDRAQPGLCRCRRRRWQAFTGETAVLEGDDRSFADIAAQRARQAA